MGELPLLLAREFGESEVERGDEEERIVAEAGVASGMVEELAFDGAMGAEPTPGRRNGTIISYLGTMESRQFHPP